MRHYAITLGALAGTSILLAPPAVAQTAGTGVHPLVIVLLILVLIAAVAGVVLSIYDRGTLTRTFNGRFNDLEDQMGHLRGRIDPELPEGESDSLEHWMARLQSDHAGLMGAANALRKKLGKAERELAEANASLEEERRKRQAAEGNLATAKDDFGREQTAHQETRTRLQKDVDGLKAELGDIIGEHFATHRVAERVAQQHPDIDGKKAPRVH